MATTQGTLRAGVCYLVLVDAIDQVCVVFGGLQGLLRYSGIANLG